MSSDTDLSAEKCEYSHFTRQSGMGIGADID